MLQKINENVRVTHKLCKMPSHAVSSLQSTIAEGQDDLPGSGRDVTGIIHRQKQSILDIEGAIEAEIKKKGEHDFWKGFHKTILMTQGILFLSGLCTF